VHFWFYPALAAPFVRACDLLGVSPVYGFTALHVLLLAGSFWLAAPRVGAALAWLLWAGPALWWLDKPHTEVFTFSLLATAMPLLAESPGWALVAIGAAATQNPPIVIALPLALLALAIARPATLRSRTVWMGAGAACALFAAHLLYYQIRHGMPFLLFGATSRVFPTLAELMVVPFDSNLGIVPAFPAFAAIVSVAAVVLLRRPRQLLTPDILLSIGVLPFFLVSFTQTSNVHHGGTPGLSRYGIWLVPLALPLLRAFRRAAPGWSARLGFILAIPSAIACALMFHPKHPDNYREPIWLAHVLRARHPVADQSAARDLRGSPVASRRSDAAGGDRVLREGSAGRAWRRPGHVAASVLPGGGSTRMPDTGGAVLRESNARRIRIRADPRSSRAAFQIRARSHVGSGGRAVRAKDSR
jgi:hypothetical protein